ncbi:hypothetical protein E1264_16660 [Actinomadura sp. KC216]|uniref:hypothetical protein n=1 Tax=Actinomadura sp. KC216 TaxID=2530370 RepID=UPI00104C7131|nr:hypothetical protein [Actinomadura sp. KC216]TDB86844.1 hypothetical protein E1264_16660 [Actinomadura sp. KC216]
MRRSTSSLVAGITILLATFLTPGSASAQEATWTVTPGGAFTGEGTIKLDGTVCYLRFNGTFFDSSGQGRIDQVNVHGCSNPAPLGYPSFRVPISLTATKYLSSIDTTAGPFANFVIDIQGPCPVRLGSPNDPPNTVEFLYDNENATMWWSSGLNNGLRVYDPRKCYDKESVNINNSFTITPAQTIRPSE